MYNRRSKFDPFWNNFVVGGIQDGVPFLGTVDKLGTAYSDRTICTGYGAHIATPILRDALEKIQLWAKMRLEHLWKNVWKYYITGMPGVSPNFN